MPIVRVKWYSREQIREHPDWLWAFGDNVAQVGRGGQAKQCRGEPNCIGIPTKWRPSMDQDAFFCDEDMDTIKPKVQETFRRLAAHIENGGTAVWPMDGVGTGLARLPTCAPAIHDLIQKCLRELERRAGD
jgi:hypothetical protein